MRLKTKVVFGMTLCLVSLAAKVPGQEVRKSLAGRQIIDPNLGLRWQLVHVAIHPGGPERLVPSEASADSRLLQLPIIRSGARIRVEEHTSVSEVMLQGVAFDSAAPGDLLRVRLVAGGRLVWVVAVDQSRAVMARAGEAWR